MALLVKKPPANTGDLEDEGSVSGLGRSPGGEHGNPLQYSCLEKSMDRGAWWATVHGVAEHQTRLRWLSTAQHSQVVKWWQWLLFPTVSRLRQCSHKVLSGLLHLTWLCLRRASVTAVLWVRTLVLTLGSTVSLVSTCCPPAEKKYQPNFLYYVAL